MERVETMKLLEDWWGDKGEMKGFPFKIKFIHRTEKGISNDMFFEKDSVLWEMIDKYFLKEYVINDTEVPLIIFPAGQFGKDKLICVLPNIYAGEKIPQYFGNEVDPCLMVYRGGRHLLNVFELKDLVKLDKKLFVVAEDDSKKL